MRLMTSNIWGDYFGNEVEGRDEMLLSVYRKYLPDVIAFQEFTTSWYKSRLPASLSESYAFCGTELYDGGANYTPLALRRECSLIAKGFEYLIDTPTDRSKAITWGVAESGGRRFAVCGTHFWWMSGRESEADKKRLAAAHGELAYFTPKQHDMRRALNAAQLTRLMKRLSSDYRCPVFAMGDMNTTVLSPTFELYAQNGVKDLFDIALERDDICSHHGDPQRGDDRRFHGSRTERDHFGSIDHIVGFGEGFSVERYRVVEDSDALDATDHSPVFADVRLDDLRK